MCVNFCVCVCACVCECVCVCVCACVCVCVCDNFILDEYVPHQDLSCKWLLLFWTHSRTLWPHTVEAAGSLPMVSSIATIRGECWHNGGSVHKWFTNSKIIIIKAMCAIHSSCISSRTSICFCMYYTYNYLLLWILHVQVLAAKLHEHVATFLSLLMTTKALE